MLSLLYLCLGLFLVSCANGQAPEYLGALYGRCSSESVMAAKACTTVLEHNVSSTTPGLFYTDTKQFCRNQPAMGEFAVCLNRSLTSCLPPGLLPTSDSALDAFNFYCRNYNDTNNPCIYERFTTNYCFSQAFYAYSVNATMAMSLPQAAWDRVVTQSTCNFLRIMRGCAYTVRDNSMCVRHRLDVFDTYWAKTFPPACVLEISSGASGLSTSFLLLGACAVLLTKMAALF